MTTTSPQKLPQEAITLANELSSAYLEHVLGISVPTQLQESQIPILIQKLSAWSGVDTAKLEALKKLMEPQDHADVKKLKEMYAEAAALVTMSEKYLTEGSVNFNANIVAIISKLQEVKRFREWVVTDPNDPPVDIVTNGVAHKIWYDVTGNIHRGGDKPAIIYKSGSRCWYVHGKCYRNNDDSGHVIMQDDTFEKFVETYGMDCLK